jgi:hypothetical protein
VHKKQNYHDSFEAGDPDRYDWVPDTQINKRNARGSGGKHHQDQQDQQVSLGADDMMFVLNRLGHGFSPSPAISKDGG